MQGHSDSDSRRPPVIFLMGPTASGKTDLALALSEHYPVEVISVDSALVYRGMDIGTAKPDAEFLARLPHFLVDICDPDQTYSAAQFRRDALRLIDEITARGHIPLLVGGTMLYFKVLLEGIADIPPVPSEISEAIEQRAQRLGWPALHAELAQVDPEAAARIHPNHSQRIQRALAVYKATGTALSVYHREQAAAELPFRPLQLALDCDRSILHRRIETRFRLMLERGFVDELRQLRADWSLEPSMPSMLAVGYRQVWQYLDGGSTEQEMIAQGVAATRQLAKRQLTWLRKWPDLHCLSLAEPALTIPQWSDELAVIGQLWDQMNI